MDALSQRHTLPCLLGTPTAPAGAAGELLIRGALGLIRGMGYVYSFTWKRYGYVSYHDDIELCEILGNATAGVPRR
ncbi:hypothetical protein ACH4M4_31575 [Streptomyces sp. NPDC017254]|uniref:hypothetical protein n=1 Tax=unclassified Streptomyces TaxID=2593676 RepID=UPI00378CB3B7